MPLPTAAAVLAVWGAVAAEEEFDPNDVTPGVVGFIVTFLLIVAVLLLIFDMVRRIRRVNYRAEARERIEAEESEVDAVEGGRADATASDDPDVPIGR